MPDASASSRSLAENAFPFLETKPKSKSVMPFSKSCVRIFYRFNHLKQFIFYKKYTFYKESSCFSFCGMIMNFSLKKMIGCYFC